MTKKELMERIYDLLDDDVVVVTDGQGWCNISEVKNENNRIELVLEKR